MNNLPGFSTLPVLVTLFTAAAAALDTACAASVSVSAYAAEGNQMLGRVLGTYDGSSTPLVTVNGSGQSSHDLSGVGGSGTLQFQGSASAYASYHSLRAQASGSVSNSFYDEDYDHEAETGVPTAYFAQGTASFSQTLLYGGTANNYTSTYIMRLTGTVQGSGRAAISVDLTHGMESPQSWFFSAEGSYDVLLYSQAWVHGRFAQEFSLSVNTLYSFDMDGLPAGGSYSGSADFGSTLEVIGIDLRDESGVLQPQGTITSDSGETFQIIPVPEPSSAVLLGALGLASALRRRR